MQIFLRLRGTIPKHQEEDHITLILEKFQFDQQIWDKAVKDLSKAVRRRLSVAIAFAGNTKVILLEEPTKGLDSANKKIIWESIRNSNKDKCILITTHSTEEVEDVCDRIGILSKGKMRAIGTAPRLKQSYGNGERLRIICSKGSDKKRIVLEVKKHIPHAILIEDSNALVFRIKNVDFPTSIQMVQFLNSLKKKKKNKEKNTSNNIFISDWELYGSTLEDVFLSVVHK